MAVGVRVTRCTGSEQAVAADVNAFIASAQSGVVGSECAKQFVPDANEALRTVKVNVARSGIYLAIEWTNCATTSALTPTPLRFS
mgnify:FL=1